MKRLVALVVLLFAAEAGAQGNSFNNSEATVNALKDQVGASQQMVIQQQNQTLEALMRDPAVWAAYERYRQQGGPMDYPHFAYQYGLTGGFTAEGAAIARKSLDANTEAERRAYEDYRRSEEARTAAQGQAQTGFGENLQESGNMLQGNGTWVDATGRAYQLPQAAPNAPLYDPATNRYFNMDARGTWYVSMPNGTWQALRPYQ